MKQRLLAQSQKLLRRILRVFSLGAVMFIMEACYGISYDRYHEYSSVKVLVVNTNGEPIPNIAVHFDDYTDHPAVVYSDSKGFAELKLANTGELADVSFMDIDKEANGLYAIKTISVPTDYYYREITVVLQSAQ